MYVDYVLDANIDGPAVDTVTEQWCAAALLVHCKLAGLKQALGIPNVDSALMMQPELRSMQVLVPSLIWFQLSQVAVQTLTMQTLLFGDLSSI